MTSCSEACISSASLLTNRSKACISPASMSTRSVRYSTLLKSHFLVSHLTFTSPIQLILKFLLQYMSFQSLPIVKTWACLCLLQAIVWTLRTYTSFISVEFTQCSNNVLCMCVPQCYSLRCRADIIQNSLTATRRGGAGMRSFQDKN